MTAPTRRGFLTGIGALAAARARFGEALSEAPRSSVADDYDLTEGLVYLNHASIGTVPRLVREAHARYLSTCEENPWLYVWGGAWEEGLEDVHGLSASFLGCEPEAVAILRNTTEAFGLAANSLPLGEGDEVLFSSLNHVGASASWEHASVARGFTVRRFEFPRLDDEATPERVLAAYSAAVGDSTRVLVLPHVDNVFGIRHPVAAIASMARARGVEFICVDGAQSVGMHPVVFGDLGVDIYATSAHKWLQAPKGTGLMVVSEAARRALRPLVTTWGQRRWAGTARGLTDYGTRDLPRLLALGDALRFQMQRSSEREEHDRSLFLHSRARVTAAERLDWRSPTSLEHGSTLYAVGIDVRPAGELARSLFEDEGIVVRGFGGANGNHLRISPNTLNTVAQLDQLYDVLEARLGR